MHTSHAHTFIYSARPAESRDARPRGRARITAGCVSIWHVCVTGGAKRSDGPEPSAAQRCANAAPQRPWPHAAARRPHPAHVNHKLAERKLFDPYRYYFPETYTTCEWTGQRCGTAPCSVAVPRPLAARVFCCAGVHGSCSTNCKPMNPAARACAMTHEHMTAR